MIKEYAIIFWTRHLQPYAPILKIGKGRKPVTTYNLSTGKDTYIMLESSVQIPFVAAIIE